MEKEVFIRKAEDRDIPLILSFIKMIAEYEKLSAEVIATEEDIRNSVFSTNSNVKIIFAYYKDIPVAYAVYFYNFSTFIGRKGLYLEDIFVIPEYRKEGIGQEVFKYLVKEAVKNNCGRMEWSVLNWNEPAIKFYEKIGAVPLKEWTVFRLTEDKFENFIK